MRIKILLFILAIGLIHFNLNGQTNVGGTLTSNTIWTIDGSPYILTSTVGVPEGITLTIEPGVEIRGEILSQNVGEFRPVVFTYNYEVVIYGQFIALGNIDNVILFNDLKLSFKNEKLTNYTISNANFSRTELYFDFQNETFVENNIFHIQSCEFNAYSSIYGYNTDSYSKKIKLFNSFFDSASIYCNGISSIDIDFNNCIILNSEISSYSPIEIIYCTTRGSKIETSNETLMLNKSKFVNTVINFKGDGIIDSTYFYDSPIIAEYNYTRSIANSIFFFNNSNKHDVNIEGYDFYTSFVMAGKNISISNSSIYGTGEGVALNVSGSNCNNVTIGNVDTLFVFSSNSVVNNSNLLNSNIQAFINNSNQSIQATNNWWGATDEGLISEVIYDMFDNINLGQVDYSNYLTSLDTIAPISSPINIFKSSIDIGIVVKWNSNLESDIAGYKIYYNPIDEFTYANSIDVGNDTTFTISDIGISETIVVTAYDNQADGTDDLFEGHESWYSQPAQFYFTNDLLSGNSYCIGDEIQYQINAILDFDTDNNFIIQLSDTSGNFNTPIELFTVDTSFSVLINTSFPDTLVFSEQYSIRVKSTNPESYSNPEIVTFHQIPTPTFKAPEKVCYNRTANIEYMGTASSLAVYNWNFDNGSVLYDTEEGLYEISWDNSGLKTIFLNVTENGCSSDTSINVIVNQETHPISICMVSVDSSNHNMVIWEQSIDYVNDSIIIYKETSQSDVYEKIGTQASNSTTVFTDANSNPAQSSNRYKIAVIDTCGYETSKSVSHKTIHLTINSEINGAWNLIWDGYEGFSSATYNIYRGTSDNNMLKIAELVNNTFSHSDLIPPEGSVYYQIEIVNPNSCNIGNSISTNDYFSSTRSNIVNSNQVNLIDDLFFKDIEIYPNPADDKLYLKSITTIKCNMEILSLDGKTQIKNQNIEDNKEIDISNLKPGLYLIRLSNNNRIKHLKLIKR